MKPSQFISGMITAVTLLIGTTASAHQCPKIGGLYQLLLTDNSSAYQDSGEVPPRNQYYGMQFDPYVYTIQTELTMESPSNERYISVDRNGNVYSSRGVYQVDGFERYFQLIKDADNYFVKYTAKCENNKLIIHQSGSDNNSNSKRVSTYSEDTIAFEPAPGLLHITTKRQVFDTASVKMFQMSLRKEYKRLR